MSASLVPFRRQSSQGIPSGLLKSSDLSKRYLEDWLPLSPPPLAHRRCDFLSPTRAPMPQASCAAAKASGAFCRAPNWSNASPRASTRRRTSRPCLNPRSRRPARSVASALGRAEANRGDQERRSRGDRDLPNLRAQGRRERGRSSRRRSQCGGKRIYTRPACHTVGQLPKPTSAN